MNIRFNNIRVYLFFLLFPSFLSAQNIIPQPKSFVPTEGVFKLNVNTIIGMNDNSLLPQANYLQTELNKLNGITIAVDPDETKAQVDLQITRETGPPGSYQLTIRPDKITIVSADNGGIFYGIVSLLQLIAPQSGFNSVNLNTCEITDVPRYQWRGFMLDESRHFFGKEKVKQLLDWMAFYKLNKFHWHLTDVEAWRIEIKKYPKLAQIGGIGNHTDSLAAAQYYTQQDIKEIVAYAADRFITVIPEIDMPGHATAANRAYPDYSGGIIARYKNFTFDPANENTYSYLSDILKEVNELFPSHMIHLGGDEVELGMQAWAGRPAVTKMMAKNKFSTLDDLEHYFFNRMADSVIQMNDEIVCWDEALAANLPVNHTLIFWWRQNFPSQLELALQKKYNVVLCPRLPLYLDFVQDKNHASGRKWNGIFFNSLADIYSFPDKLIPSGELQTAQILGIQANLWTETIGSGKRLDFMIFPRMAALAESAWTPQAQKNEASFNERLKLQFALYDKAGIYYYNPFDPSAHPEAIDFVPRIENHIKKNRHHRHERQSKSGYRHKKGKHLTKEKAKRRANKKKHPLH